MGKVRKPGPAKGGGSKGVDTTVGKISADIGAISLGPPRSKILKKTATSSSASSLSANFASRATQKKKTVRFCQNLITEELKVASTEGENAKHYFKVIHPSAIEKRKKGGIASRINSLIPDNDVLLSTSGQNLRKIIKKSVKNKKIRLKARKESFKKKMELIKANKDELQKAKQRQQTVIVGDMLPMLDSLPSLETNEGATLQTESASAPGGVKSIPKKTKFSVKKTQKAILDSLKFFEAAGVGKTAAGLSAN